MWKKLKLEYQERNKMILEDLNESYEDRRNKFIKEFPHNSFPNKRSSSIPNRQFNHQNQVPEEQKYFEHNMF